MCGICGIIGVQSEQDVNVVKRMNDAIIHRGPDDAGFFQNGFCALAMRRLSIIDLHTGKQPIFNETQDILVFQNGEIYNYIELKQSLIAKGHHFKTNSDTEVIVHLFEEYGTKVFEYLKGMFAICIYALKSKIVYLGRDRFGEKPLFYHFKNQKLSFSSEIKSLLENKEIRRKLDKSALDYYLKLGYLPEPLSLLENVQSLPPGHFLVYQNGQIQTKKYFKINYDINPKLTTSEGVIKELFPKMEKAVQRQRISDVPLGAFLSGGIDSSSLVALLQKDSTEKLKTFTVKFEESSYDESSIAKKVASHLGTDHHEITIPNHEFDEELFWKILDHAGTPFTDTSAIPTYFITKEIRKFVKVAISGDGGDELFGGYSTFHWWQKLRKLQHVPNFVIRPLAVATKTLRHAPIFKSASKVRQLHKALTYTQGTKEEMAINILELFDDIQLQQLLINNKGIINYPAFSALSSNINFPSDLREIMHYRLKFNLPSDMLVKVDRMSMANSLEVRAPFLDADLFQFSTTIPDHFLIHKNQGKYIVRKMMKEYLPNDVFNHPKSGFGIPIHKYMNADYEGLCHKLFKKDHPLFELLDYEQVQNIVKMGFTNMEDNAKITTYKSSLQLWSLMQLFGWVNHFEIEI